MGWSKELTELETVNINEMVIETRVNKQHGLFLIDFYPSRLALTVAIRSIQDTMSF